jgi:hypothetical protein
MLVFQAFIFENVLEQLFIFFLIDTIRDFGEKISCNGFSIRSPNITVFYSEFSLAKNR